MSLVADYLKHQAARKRNEVTIFKGSIIEGGVHENGFPEAIVKAAEQAEKEGIDPSLIEVKSDSLEKVESQTVGVPQLIDTCRAEGYELEVGIPKVISHLGK